MTKEDLYQFIEAYVERQQLVYDAMMALRPDLLAIYDCKISNDELIRLVKRSACIPVTGWWIDSVGNEWQYQFHGRGCKLVHSKTGEPIEWDAPHVNTLNFHWFMQWLTWRMQNDTRFGPKLIDASLIRKLVQQLHQLHWVTIQEDNKITVLLDRF